MTGKVVTVAEVGITLREEMLSLLGRHFAGVDSEQFHSDLDGKTHAILLYNDAGELVGFTTLRLYHTAWQGEVLTVVYSGDTIVDPSAWGSLTLLRIWLNGVWRLHHQHGRGRLVWLLITSGYRTYRFLPVFWREFWPRHDRPTPGPVRQLIDHLAAERFGPCYGRAAGLVRFDRPQRLRPHLCDLSASRMRDPHVAFFIRHNPGHGRGDELVCLTEMSEANLTRAGLRMLRAGRPRPADMVESIT